VSLHCSSIAQKQKNILCQDKAKSDCIKAIEKAIEKEPLRAPEETIIDPATGKPVTCRKLSAVYSLLLDRPTQIECFYIPVATETIVMAYFVK
jgi:hypothetical protein